VYRRAIESSDQLVIPMLQVLHLTDQRLVRALV
jgi:hypothetical protein